MPVAKAVALVMANRQLALLCPIMLSVLAVTGVTETLVKEPARANRGAASQAMEQKNSAKTALNKIFRCFNGILFLFIYYD